MTLEQAKRRWVMGFGWPDCELEGPRLTFSTMVGLAIGSGLWICDNSLNLHHGRRCGRGTWDNSNSLFVQIVGRRISNVTHEQKSSRSSIRKTCSFHIRFDLNRSCGTAGICVLLFSFWFQTLHVLTCRVSPLPGSKEVSGRCHTLSSATCRGEDMP